MTFYLTIADPAWMWRTRIPVMISRRRLANRPPRLRHRPGKWVLDSGGFTELHLHGRYHISAKDYAREADTYHRSLGNMAWAAIQDWMCEPFMLHKTGLTVREHQLRTVASYLELRTLAPSVPWLPVLQGYTFAEYQTCAALYSQAGVDLTSQPVGIGSVCRRQLTQDAGDVIRWAHGCGMSLHAFGFKVQGVQRYGHLLGSSDSMAWSAQARHQPPLPGCSHPHCQNCIQYALRWRTRVLGAISDSKSQTASQG